MRLGLWTLAAIGCAGLALSVGFAAEPGSSSDPNSTGETRQRSSYPYFNQKNKLSRPTTTAISGSLEESAEPSKLDAVEGKPLPTRSIRGDELLKARAGQVGVEPASHSVPSAEGDLPHSQTKPSPNAVLMLDTNATHETETTATHGEEPSGLVNAEHTETEGEAGSIEQVQLTDEKFAPFEVPENELPPEPEADVPSSKTSAKSRELPFDAAPRTAAVPMVPVSHEPQSPPAQVVATWASNGGINIGQECECSLVVKNVGGTAAQQVSVDAHFPPSVRLTGTVPCATEHEDHLTWEFAALAPGEEQTIRVRLVPSERGQLATVANVRFSSSLATTFTVEEPMLEVAVQGPKEVMVGEPASQIILVSNPGTGVANNVTIESVIPEGLEHARGTKLVMEIGALNPGESRSVRLVLAAVSGGEHTIQIVAKADSALSQETSAAVAVIAPSVKLALDGPSVRFIGRNAEYTITVENDGAAASNNVRVLHRIPEGFDFTRADKGGQFDPNTRIVSWFVGHLEAGQTSQLKVDLSPTKTGDFVHRAGAISEHGTKSTAEMHTQVEGAASLVLEIVDQNDPVEIGVDTAYEIRVRNDGSMDATNVGVSCELPEGVELVNATGPTDSRADRGLIAFKAIDHLSPGKTAIFRVQVRGKVDGSHRFRARLASDSIQEPLVFEELTRFYVD